MTSACNDRLTAVSSGSRCGLSHGTTVILHMPVAPHERSSGGTRQHPPGVDAVPERVSCVLDELLHESGVC